MRRPAVAAALLFTALSFPAFAQSSTDHDHPGTGQVQVPAQTTSPAGPSRQGMMGGMMGAGMMGHMKGRGMMAGDPMGPPIMFRMVFALMDSDSDGTVSMPEFQLAHERIFKAMDSNKDGKLTQEEMLAFMQGTRSSGPQH